MPTSDTYTPFLQEPEPKDREQAVESYLKARLQSLDRAVAGYTSVSLQGLSGSVDLTPTQAKHRRVKFTGNPAAAVTVRIPHATGANADVIFVNECGGSFSLVTVKSTGANASNPGGVSLPAGYSQHAYHDGESAYPVGAPHDASGRVPSASAFQSGTQSVPHNTWTVLGLNSELYDVGGMHDNLTNNSRIVCRVPGLYDMGAAARIAGNAAGNRFIQINLNGTTNVNADGKSNMGATQDVYLSLTAHYRLAVGDYVELRVLQDSGGSLSTMAGSAALWIAHIGG